MVELPWTNSPPIQFDLREAVGKVGGHKVADRPLLLAIAEFENKHPGIIAGLVLAEKWIKSHPSAGSYKRAEWVTRLIDDLRTWGTLSPRKAEVAADILKQIAEEHEAYIDQQVGNRRRAAAERKRREEKGGNMPCPRCGREIRFRKCSTNVYMPDGGLNLDASLKRAKSLEERGVEEIRIWRHKTPWVDWCFPEQQRVIEREKEKV